MALSLGLQFLVLYVSPMQRAFGTVALGPADWLRCLAVASSVLWLMEAKKIVGRRSEVTASPELFLPN
jgi:Ca2+-transporting ATPase